MNTDQKYLDKFEEKLLDSMLRLCSVHKMLDSSLLNSPDIDDHWQLMAPEYLADAVPQIQEYPTVAVAWAGYLGMAVAYGWDVSWETMSKYPYQSFYGERGFDDMDEHIVRDVLGIALNSNEAKAIEDIMRRCAQMAVDHIRHEQIEPQSPLAFHAFVRTCKVMYRIGAAIELKKLGYKIEAIGGLPS